MFNKALKRKLSDLEAKSSELNELFVALDRSTAIIEFNAEGNVASANNNFCACLVIMLTRFCAKRTKTFAWRALAEALNILLFGRGCS